MNRALGQPLSARGAHGVERRRHLHRNGCDVRRLTGAFALGAVALACGARSNLEGVAGAPAVDAGVPAADAGVSGRDAGASTDGDARDAGTSFPDGTYTRCAFGTVSTGPFLIPSGFDDGATLTVTKSGDQRTATFADGSGRGASWSFTTTTSVSAVLAPNAPSTPGFGNSICVYGVGVSNENFFPTSFAARWGAMTYESGAVFLALRGEIRSRTDCGDVAAPASVWIGCTGGPAPDVGASTAVLSFPIGDYTCTSQVGTHTTLDGKNAFITSGGSGGALTVTQSGARVTALYLGDPWLTGTLDFALGTASTGTGVAGQTLTARCAIDPTTAEFSVTAASLAAADDGTAFLSFAGTMTAGGACPGGEKIATLVCAKK
jgi:hypothetical protein